MRQTLLALMMTVTMGISQGEKNHEEIPLEHLVGDPISVSVNRGCECSCRSGGYGYMSTSLEVDGRTISAFGHETSCQRVNEAADLINWAYKRGIKVDLVVCRQGGRYGIHSVTAEGYIVTF